MLIAKIADQLGNQMFTYASIKTIAQDRNESFAFIRAFNDRINDSDKKYGNELHTIFPNIENEYLEDLPESITHTYAEPPLRERCSNYQSETLQVPADTLMIGHYISYRYFSHNLEHVRQWFTFPADISVPVEEELRRLRKKYPDRVSESPMTTGNAPLIMYFNTLKTQYFFYFTTASLPTVESLTTLLLIIPVKSAAVLWYMICVCCPAVTGKSSATVLFPLCQQF